MTENRTLGQRAAASARLGLWIRPASGLIGAGLVAVLLLIARRRRTRARSSSRTVAQPRLDSRRGRGWCAAHRGAAGLFPHLRHVRARRGRRRVRVSSARAMTADVVLHVQDAADTQESRLSLIVRLPKGRRSSKPFRRRKRTAGSTGVRWSKLRVERAPHPNSPRTTYVLAVAPGTVTDVTLPTPWSSLPATTLRPCAHRLSDAFRT